MRDLELAGDLSDRFAGGPNETNCLGTEFWGYGTWVRGIDLSFWASVPSSFKVSTKPGQVHIRGTVFVDELNEGQVRPICHSDRPAHRGDRVVSSSPVSVLTAIKLPTERGAISGLRLVQTVPRFAIYYGHSSLFASESPRHRAVDRRSGCRHV